MCVVLVSRLLYCTLKSAMAMSGRVIHAPRSESQMRQWMQIVCKVYEGEMADGTDAVTLRLHTHWWNKRIVWVMALVLTTALFVSLESVESLESLESLGAVMPTCVPFVHQLLDMPECRDAAPNDTHCVSDWAWHAPTERRFFVDELQRLWFSTQIGREPLLWREEMLHDDAGVDCLCPDELGHAQVTVIRDTGTRLVLYDAHHWRTQHDGALVIAYVTPRSEWTSREMTLLRDYNRRVRSHNWTVLRQLPSSQATLQLRGEAAACFTRCSGRG